MKDNKLIAEFMDLRSTGLSIYKESDYKYHKSWDWLMPVIEKISTQEATNTLSSTIEMLAEYYYKDGDNQDGLEGIEEFYKAVVFWIEEYKSIPLDKFEKEIEEIQRIELENTSMIKIGTEVKIIDNFHEHVGYVEDSIVKIIEHDEYGNYILSSGHCCSESEMEIIKTI
jgi:hypothetical protein